MAKNPLTGLYYESDPRLKVSTLGFRPLGYGNGGSVNNDGSSYGMSEAAQITKDEGGDRATTYIDEVLQRDGTTKEVLTGGTGHKLTEAEQDLYPDGTEVPPEIRAAWFEKDMETAMMDARSLLPSGAPPELYNILVNMAFNLGKPGLMKFDNMLGAIHGNNYPRAALEMEWINPDDRSKGRTPWRFQTGDRSQRLIDRMYGLVISRGRLVDPTVPRMRIFGDIRPSDQAIEDPPGMRNGGIMAMRRY